MSNIKILCIIQARMGSERLPGKVMNILGNKPVVEHVINRSEASKYIGEVVLATSEVDSELPMIDYLKKNHYNTFRGDENNVLKRYVDCEAEYQGDVIVRITGDCPFVDPGIIDQVISYFISNDFDYVRLDVPKTMVRGFDVEVFSAEAMKKVYQITERIDGDSPYKEHVTYYMYTHPEEFKIGYVEGSEMYQKDYRICVDTTEDFEVVQQIYNYFQDDYISAKDIIKFLDEHPEVTKINSGVNQKHE